jgi:hypothetical protein
MGQTTGTPMSGDVHLFPDPKSLPTIRPLLYCDCEGLDGGNNPAVGSLSKKLNDLRAMLPEQVSCKADENWKVSGYRKRDVQFAQNQDQSQQWVVNHLYPTILYTFSDVICFVTKNTRYYTLHMEIVMS